MKKEKEENPGRGISSVGRAPALQAGGHEFESRILHWMFSDIMPENISMYLENRIQEINEMMKILISNSRHPR